MNPLKNRRTLFAAICVSALLFAGALTLIVLISGQTSVAVFSSSSSTATAKLTVNVVEGYTETPIEGASVVVVETGQVYSTDASGYTEVMEVPVIRDTRYDDILSKSWGEITLIIYKDGFVPYALFYLQVAAGETREGVKILLFEQGDTESSEPFSIIEGPNRVWVDALIEMYQPEN